MVKIPDFVFLTLIIHLGAAQGLVGVADISLLTPTLSLMVDHLTHRVGPTLGSVTGVDTLPVAAIILSTGQTGSTVSVGPACGAVFPAILPLVGLHLPVGLGLRGAPGYLSAAVRLSAGAVGHSFIPEWSTLIGRDTGKYCALIGWDQVVDKPAL